MMKSNNFFQTTLLRPCFIFHNCEQLTAGKHNHVQVCTASHNNSPHFYFGMFFVIFHFSESTFEQNWVGFDTLITETSWLREGAITFTASHNDKVTTAENLFFLTFFYLFVTLSKESDGKVKKNNNLSNFEKNWARTPNTCLGIVSSFELILSNFELHLRKFELLLASPSYFLSKFGLLFGQFWATLSNFEQNWAGFARAHQYFL